MLYSFPPFCKYNFRCIILRFFAPFPQKALILQILWHADVQLHISTGVPFHQGVSVPAQKICKEKKGAKRIIS